MKTGFLFQPPEFYRGRIPFIIKDLVDQLNEMDAANSVNLFSIKDFTNVAYLLKKLNHGRIQDWTEFTDSSVLAVSLIKYLNEITKQSPLISNKIANLLINNYQKNNTVDQFFQLMRNEIYSGNYRILLFIINFLKSLTKIKFSEKYKHFYKSFLGTDTKYNKILFSLLFRNTDIIFKSKLSERSFLTDKDITYLYDKMIQQAPEKQPIQNYVLQIENKFGIKNLIEDKLVYIPPNATSYMRNPLVTKLRNAPENFN